MNYKTSLFLAILVLVTVNSSAQGVRFGVGLGYAQFDLASIKEAQNNALIYSNLSNIKATEDFPNRAYGSFSFGYEFNYKNSLTFDYSFYSTGGRNAVTDYSGEYKLDMELEASKYGLSYNFNKTLSDKFSLGGSLSAGVILTRYDISEIIKINGGTGYNNEVSLRGLNIFLQPSIVTTYNIIDQLDCFLLVGYEKNIPRNMHLVGDREARSNLEANWTGIRIGTGIYYALKSD